VPFGYLSAGTRQFKEDFISIEWVTPQFEQTLDKVMKSREMPKPEISTESAKKLQSEKFKGV